ncbi:Rne/Rng family ribonuclease [Anaeroselena agilis]|uniref:Ribonuclease G n=1 Tax=Anaeroselena agilis TaxID=3063788 RepID=A0ABU3NZP3_9FIRM|nr:Rne/Rng family ribonuclease [Selenomonadales bacterium 4137-cl]
MAKTIIVNVVPEETRMALIENGELAEVAIERTHSGHIVGSIYKGKIQNVLPGMQAVFVDIGRERNAFLYVGDLGGKTRRKGEAYTTGREIVVQVAKEAIGTKGPRLTTHLTLPGRYVVLMPTVDFIGVSRRIGTADERKRLKELAAKVRPKGMGLVVRTVAEGRTEDDLRKDCDYLVNLWKSLTARGKMVKAPTLLYRDVDLLIRIVRDYLSGDVEKFILDNREAHARVVELLRAVSPELLPRLELYDGDEDIFARHRLEGEIEKLSMRRVDLKCGGYIVIDRTEALTVIDVNTGKFVGKTRLADTVFAVNMEAAAEIARQIRLRDIGGIIVADFIDMDREQHKQDVLAALNEHLRKDRTRTNVVGLTGLGLVEMTRKKVRQDITTVLNSQCPCCEGRGFVRSPETVAAAVRRQLRQLGKGQSAAHGRVVIQVHPRVAELLQRPGEVERLSQETARRITVEAVADMGMEAYSFINKD